MAGGYFVGRVRSIGCRHTACLAMMTFLLALAAGPAFAQPAADQMCGDGSTFTVPLPGTSLGIDDSEGLFRSIDVPAIGPPDSITLPGGCSLYVLLVSGYHQNEHFDRITFFKVAEFAARNNGYVHVAWWNNLLAPYMERPLHPVTFRIERLFQPDKIVHPNPGGYDPIQLQGNLVPNNFIDLPKANPDENFQFLSDARLMIQAINTNNPGALIIVVGHSMGADSVARLGRESTVPIDLLAVIDPGNNRDKPRGIYGANPQVNREYNWTRWRATHLFHGFRQWDCVRNGLGLCRDFDSRPFRFSYACEPVGPFLEVRPLIPTLAPLVCPRLLPYIDPGTRHVIGSNVRHLYHRWQHEFLFPFDYLATERFGYPAPRSTSILGLNYQEPVLPNAPGESDPSKTCSDVTSVDPRRFPLPALCGQFDGHGEIVGMRAPQNDRLNPLADLELPGLGMRSWPTDAAGRRTRMIELATADASWPHRPFDPDTCMVCDDIIAITQHLLDEQADPGDDTTPPVTVATLDPGANAAGWNRQDVVVSFQASDGTGSGIQEIEFASSGAQAGDAVQAPGASAETSITTEGTTTITFRARDNAGNEESPIQSPAVKIDTTPPIVEAVATPQPNAAGWNNTDVAVSFTASDALSGLATAPSAQPVSVTAEGANQEIVGSATDLADNQASASAVVSLDRTAPTLSGTPDRLPDSHNWYNHRVTLEWSCTDGLSGVDTFSSPVRYVGPDSPSATLSGTCVDVADNTAHGNVAFQFDATAPTVEIATPASEAVYLLNQTVEADYRCADNLSGLASCTGPVADGAALDTSFVNEHQFRVHATDVANNGTKRTHGYSVHYGFSGFASPVRSTPDGNVARAGRTIPIRFSLHDANGAPLADLASVVSLTSIPAACQAAVPLQRERISPSRRRGIRYDATTAQFVFNWKTNKAWAGTCQLLQVALNDGTTHQALFRFR